MTNPPKRVVAVMPAYNAERTLERTLADIPPGCLHEIILTDDASGDRTVELAQALGLTVIVHNENRGYGANQKTCYTAAVDAGADAVVMIHADYQYDPRVIPHALGIIELGICDIVMGSRIRTRREALASGMPLYKYLGNRFLTGLENLLLGQNIGDFHSGFRVFNAEVLRRVDWSANSDGFVFDTELLVQAVHAGFRIGDIPIPARYFPEASSIGFRASVRYGFDTLGVLGRYALHRLGLRRDRLFRGLAQAGGR